VSVSAPPQEEQVMVAVFANEKIKPWIAEREIVKKIYVPGKLVNVVVK
jgi:leucyl-tRNA synthetase